MRDITWKDIVVVSIVIAIGSFLVDLFTSSSFLFIFLAGANACSTVLLVIAALRNNARNLFLGVAMLVVSGWLLLVVLVVQMGGV